MTLLETINYPQLSFPGGSDGKESAHNVGDLGSIPGWGRSPGNRNGNPLQCSCLHNPMDREPGRPQSMGQSLVGELRSHMLHGAAKKLNKTFFKNRRIGRSFVLPLMEMKDKRWDSVSFTLLMRSALHFHLGWNGRKERKTKGCGVKEPVSRWAGAHVCTQKTAIFSPKRRGSKGDALCKARKRGQHLTRKENPRSWPHTHLSISDLRFFLVPNPCLREIALPTTMTTQKQSSC